jgi:uncharacterized repeat protein (TIGR03803 family)
MHFLSPFRTTLGILVAAPLAAAFPTLTKLHDFNNAIPNIGIQNPYDTPVLVGSELWFTSQNGGNSGFGTFSSFDLATHVPSIRVSMNNSTGNTPQGTPVLSDGLLYYTTTRGGTGDRGTLNVFNPLAPPGTGNTVLWNSPSNVITTNPNTIPGNVAVIDRGPLGKDVYFMTSNGGSGGTAIGTIQRYQTSDGLVLTVHEFAAAPAARQPFKGFTAVGTKLYFTTFTGGNTGTGATNGAGTLNELDVTTRNAEVYQRLAAMPLGDGSTRFPGHNPYYRAADHSLYFTTAGTSTQPGSLQKYDLTLGLLTTLHELQGAATSAGPFPEGRFPYGPVTEWNRALYFTTIQGGANTPVGSAAGGGTINRYNLDTQTHEVLFNLDISTGNNTGGEARGGFLFNGSTTFPYFYLLTRQGGANDHGTILRMNLDPPLPPSPYETWIANHPALSGPSAAPAADPDHDGIANHTEFAFGSDPSSGAGSSLSMAVPSPEGLEIRWTARTDSGVSYTVTGSPTLGIAPFAWSPVSSPVVVMPVPDIAVPAGYQRRCVTIPLTEARGFFRVKADFSIGTLP